MSNIKLAPLAVALLIGIPALQTQYFVGLGAIDGAFIIATGIGLWFAMANPFAGRGTQSARRRAAEDLD